MKDEEITKFQQFANVSRETTEKFRLYAEELSKWQRRINLISPTTIHAIWERHFADSVQLANFLPNGNHELIDIGSGAGFPGLPISLVTQKSTILIERDSRKAAFLRAAIHRTAAPAHVYLGNAQAFQHSGPSVLVARAVASINSILEYVAHLITPTTYILLLKGRKAQDELTDASERWTMTVDVHPSRTSPDGVIVRLANIRRAHVPES